MSIHEAAARGFEAAAGDYERGRPSYPPEAVAYVAEALGIGPGERVLDLAAGTGKFTRLLLPAGAEVLAVEPVAAMRDELARAVPGAEVLAGSAEAIPLAGGSVDAVTIAQAFHWFANEPALAEIHRVLRPAGRLALVWNRRDPEDPVQAEIHEVLARHRGGTPTHASGAWRDVLDRSELFGELTSSTFVMEQTLDAGSLVARVLSISFMALLAGDERDAAESALRDIAERHGGVVVARYVTECHWCEAR